MPKGLPDYMGEVYRSKNIWGYVPDADEEFLFAIIIATAVPGAYAFTRAGIASAEEVELLDAFTGLEGITAGAGEDYIIKEIWIGFDQPMRFQMYQDVVGDYSCECFIPAFTSAPVHGLPIGWTRAQVEPITAESITYMRVKNLSGITAYGKAWIVGFMKEGLYEWY